MPCISPLVAEAIVAAILLLGVAGLAVLWSRLR